MVSDGEAIGTVGRNDGEVEQVPPMGVYSAGIRSKSSRALLLRQNLSTGFRCKRYQQRAEAESYRGESHGLSQRPMHAPVLPMRSSLPHPENAQKKWQRQKRWPAPRCRYCRAASTRMPGAMGPLLSAAHGTGTRPATAGLVTFPMALRGSASRTCTREGTL